jgi:hypothetical protein
MKIVSIILSLLFVRTELFAKTYVEGDSLSISFLTEFKKRSF